ncbi:MAG: hypothetical protein FWD60_09060 [Candidatus Azobacteroides sp.]|nr:hypothetical protein [Candidatus Azobacteroides sp.]
MAYNDTGYKIRASRIKEITSLHYEPENQAKCYKQVWKQHIYPLFGIGYRSYLRYLDENEQRVPLKGDDLQLELFDEY